MYQKLIEKYPAFFRDLNYGIECNSGWHNLLHDLCEKISKINPPEDFSFVQVKEKFGLLRIYVDNGNNEINDLINIAETESAKICEYCGSDQHVTSEGRWIKTLCHDCKSK